MAPYGNKNGLTHGGSKTPEYKIWNAMRFRCNGVNNPWYHNYGGRGIRVCARWDDFSNFLADMGPRPSSNHSIERLDVNGNYEPRNCIWQTWDKQCLNKRTNRRITRRGVTKTVKEWADFLKIKPQIIHNRLDKGWTEHRALTQGVGRGNKQKL